MDTCHHVTTSGAANRSDPGATFIHIPRNAGTSIEDCTSEEPEKLRWGRLSHDLQGGIDRDVTHCYMQHVPPSVLPDVYAGRETFCVVRDPYARAISQLGFAAGYYPNNWRCDARNLNTYLSQRMLD